MIEIQKIYLENFKGIKSSINIDLSKDGNSVNVLSGPNGFGKTTIFDALEICLTGQVRRINNVFGHVQKKTKNRIKPYYQNTDGSDVILKVQLRNHKTNENFVIIKHYDDSNAILKIDQGKNNIPSDSTNFFVTYLLKGDSDFDSDFSDVDPIKFPEEIDNVIYNDGQTKISQTFHLFNYLQQEESIYFLKLDEDKKGDALGFLFNIEVEVQKKNLLDSICKELDDKSTALSEKIELVESSISLDSESDAVSYNHLFDHTEIPWDLEKPFEESKDTLADLKKFNLEIDNLREFRTAFKPKEFEKSVKFKELNKILENDELLDSLILSKIYSDEILQQIESENKKIEKASLFATRKDKSIINDNFFEWFLKDSDKVDVYKKYHIRITSLNNELGELGKLISDLQTLRKQTLEHFESLKSKSEILPENKCPLCFSEFESYTVLIDSITKQTANLSSFSKQRLEEKQKILDEINTISKTIDGHIEDYLKTTKVISKKILSKIRDFVNHRSRVEGLLKAFPELDTNGNKDDKYIFEIPKTIELFAEVKNKMINFIKGSVITEYQYDDVSIENSELYKVYFNNDSEKFELLTIEAITSKSRYVSLNFDLLMNSQLVFLKKRKTKLDLLLNKSRSIQTQVNLSLKRYKSDMISRIQIPFFIYSGKILQSYQQGLGIFVNIRETGNSNKVTFTTGHSSDHDIVYHLSSGQMAVASIAFCLSLNKVYNTNEHFKFLAIDDPIQTMDDLNVHTFIELLRNDFADYQIVLSTHDDFISSYIKYKFDKYNFNTNVLNVQKLAFDQSIKPNDNLGLAPVIS